MEKTSDTAAVEIFLLRCSQPLPLSPPQRANGMLGCVCVWTWVVLVCVCVCVCVCAFKMFFISSHFPPVLMSPHHLHHHLLKVRPRFITRSESASFFYLKRSFQAYEKEGLALIWCGKCFGKSTWVLSKKLSSVTRKGNLNNRSRIRAFGDRESGEELLYFLSKSVYWACSVFIKVKSCMNVLP